MESVFLIGGIFPNMNEHLEQLKLVTKAIENKISLEYRAKGILGGEWKDVDENFPLDFNNFLYREKEITFESGKTIVTVEYHNNRLDDYLLLLTEKDDIVPFYLGQTYINRFSGRSIKYEKYSYRVSLAAIQEYFGPNYKVVKISYLDSFTYTKIDKLKIINTP